MASRWHRFHSVFSFLLLFVSLLDANPIHTSHKSYKSGKSGKSGKGGKSGYSSYSSYSSYNGHHGHRVAGIVPTLAGPTVSIDAGSYARATTLNNGALLGSYTHYANGQNILTLARSEDGGASWAFVGVAATADGATTDLDNPFPLALPGGRVLLAYRNHDKIPGTNGYSFFRIDVSVSEDSGATWAHLATVAADPGPPNGNWEPFMRVANDGTLQIYYSRETAGNDQDTLMRTSSDGGQTWSGAAVISGADVTARDGMVGVAENGPGNLIAVFETTEEGRFTVDSVTSSDDGATWGNRRRVYTPTGDGNNAGSPQVINVGGTLVVAFMTDEDTGQHHWVSGANVKLLTSGDGGATWGNKMTVFGVQSHWPGMITLDDTSFLVLVEHDGVKSQRIVLS